MTRASQSLRALIPLGAAVTLCLGTASITRRPLGPRLLPLDPLVAERLDSLGVSAGPTDAAVVVRVVADYECAACERLDRVVGRTIRSWAREGRLRFQLIQAPLPGHRRAPKAAVALICAAVQDSAWPMHDLLVGRRSEWGWGPDPRRAFLEYARGLSLDMHRFETCLSARPTEERLDRDLRGARSVGVAAVPVILVGATLVQPTHSFDEILRYVASRLPDAQS